MGKKATKTKKKVKTKPSAKTKVVSKPKAKKVSPSRPKTKVKAKVKPTKKNPSVKKIETNKASKKPAAKKEVKIKAPVNNTAAKVKTTKPAATNLVEALPKLNKPMEPRMPVVINKLTLMPIRQEGNLNAIKKAKKQDPNKTRYSDKELKEFRDIIEDKLENSRKELALLQAQITNSNDHGTDDTAGTFKVLEDGSDTLAKEEAGQMAARQRKFIEQLEAALGRIENKTYGICRVTGKLIPKERLRAVPHTTQSIEAKLNQYRD